MNNPQVVAFCNNGLRPAANALAKAYDSAKQLVADYEATGIEALLGNDSTFSDIVEDGSALDGRPHISAGGVKLTLTNIKALLAQIETVDAGEGISLIQGIVSISPHYAGL